MPIADTSQVQLAIKKESTWGTNPGGAADLLRVTGESLAQQTDTTVSNEIRSDRAVPDIIRTAVQAGGDVSFELSHATFDELLEGALFSTFSTDLGISTDTIAAAASDNSLTGSGGSEFADVVVGQWIKVAGFTEDDNNGFFKVSSKSSNAKVILTGGTLVDEAAGDTVTVNGQYLRNGTDAQSFSIEKAFTDITQYMIFTGMRIGNMALNIATGQPVNGTFSFLGKSGGISSSSGFSGTNAAPSNDVSNAIDNIKNARYNGTAAAFSMSAINFALNNNLRVQNAIASVGPIGIGDGTVNVTGNINAYFEDAAFINDYLNFNTSDLSFRIDDVDGNAYVITFPSIKFTDGTVNATGPNQDVEVAMQFTAKQDATTSCTIQIDKFAA